IQSPKNSDVNEILKNYSNKETGVNERFWRTEQSFLLKKFPLFNFF
ncbi:hypothetical protein, partial [Staphylococcus aureus]